MSIHDTAIRDSLKEPSNSMSPASRPVQSRRIGRAVAVGLAVACGFLATAGAAQGAPILDVELTHSPTTMPRTDRYMSYLMTVKNLAVNEPGLGDTLTCNGIETAPGLPKNWFPGAPGSPTFPSFSFQWTRNGVVIPGAELQTYTVTAADQGTAVQCLVTGTNAAAASTYASVPGAVISPPPATPPPAPSDRLDAGSRPDIAPTSGTAQRTCTIPANWPQPPDATYVFAWLRNGVPIDGATASTYTPLTGVGGADEGKILQCQVVGTNAGGSLVGISNNSAVNITGPPNLSVLQNPDVQLGNVTTGTVSAELELPPGTRALRVINPATSGNLSPGPPNGWSCSTTEPADVNAKVSCTRNTALALSPQQAYPVIQVDTSLIGDVPDPALATATVSGGGAPDVSRQDVFNFSGPGLPFGITPNTFLARALDEAGDDYTQAGGHPTSGMATFELNTRTAPDGTVVSIDHVREVLTTLPDGFVGNLRAIPARCGDIQRILADKLEAPVCPPGSVVGGVTLRTANAFGGGVSLWPDAALYAIPPERGAPAQFIFGYSGPSALYTLTPRLRAEDGYAITVEAPKVTKAPVLAGATVTLCSYGVKRRPAQNDAGHVPGMALFAGCKERADADANPRPFLTNPTQCAATPPSTRLKVDSWENPGVFDIAESVAPPVTGCDQVEFSPAVDIAPSSSASGSASGLEAEIDIPSDGLEDPDGLSQAHLKKAVVELPEGVSVNPSAATGLQGCSDAQLSLGTDVEPSCPDGSKLGTVEVTTPVIEEHLTGEMVLRTPKSTDPASGEMLRLALVIRNEERGLLVKLPGSTTADPQTGRLTATFDDNPQLPVGTISVHLKGGSRGVLAMPQDCGEIVTSTVLTPWSGNAPSSSQTPSTVQGDCSRAFAPGLAAGMDVSTARASGAFSFEFTREDGEQWIDGLTAALPQGLLASVRGVPLCGSADAEAGSCPAGSRIGTVDASAGAGTPFVLERKGDAYLTVGYKGCPYGLAVKVPVIAGPFDASSPETDLGNVVVRQKVCVDRSTAEVTAVSDALPTIWHGIPLRVRSVTVKVDRPGFMLNPSDCSATQVGATFHSERGASSGASARFQASDCAALPYEPRIGLRLTGRKQVRTGKHPGVRALVRQNGTDEAGIEKAVVRLPKSLALDPNNAQALCEFEDGTKPDLENHCPKGSIVGRARARTPLLNEDLVGNVYFVKNVRKDPKTGNEIRTLPMIIVALRGEIAVNLRGESSTTNGGKLVNTFANVPDAPISQFNLNIKGGKKGIIAVTRTRRARINLCAGRHIAEADTDGQNGRRSDFDIRMKTPCTKKQTRKAKRAAKAKR